jgi:2'-5' RNA ligase
MPGSWLVIMAKPSARSRTSLLDVILTNGLDSLLGQAISPPEKWHQSLSWMYDDTPENVEKLMHACAQLNAPQIELNFDRIVGPEPILGEKIHWEFLGRGNAKLLDALFDIIKSSMDRQGILHGDKKRAHITVSYAAPTTLEPIFFPPVSCPIDEILLIRSGGKPHRHEILGRFPLSPNPQLSFF